jgi:hypothetical protein
VSQATWAVRRYVLGVAQNIRLVAKIESELARAEAKSRRSGRPERCFKDFRWTTTSKSWSRHRRVVAKAEWTNGEANPRFIVTSLKRRECQARYLYENIYCAGGDGEPAKSPRTYSVQLFELSREQHLLARTDGADTKVADQSF